MIDVRKSEIGTVSHGTLKTEDLLDSFASELEHHVQRNAEAWCSDEGRIERSRLMKLAGDARDCNPDSEHAGEVVQTLIDELQRFAPEGAYFGAHPGDGSDFGYWQQEEA